MKTNHNLLRAIDTLNKAQAKVNFINTAINFQTLGEDTNCLDGLQYIFEDISNQIDESISLIDTRVTKEYVSRMAA